MEISAIIDLLEYGFVGFAVILILLTFFLLKAEQKKESPRANMLKAIYIFGGMTLIFLIIGFIASLIDREAPEVIRFRTDADAKLPILDELEEQKQIIYPYRSDDDAWEFIDENEAKILKLKICGVNLEEGIGKIIDPIESIVKRGGEVVVVMTNPLDSISLTMAASRSSNRESAKELKDKINLTLTLLRDLKKIQPLMKLDVRLINFPLDERMHIIELNEMSNLAYLKLYSYGTTTYKKQKGLLFLARDDNDATKKSIYEYYDEKFEAYYHLAQPLVW
ncbi:MAG: hypothetical protein IT222_10385 [Crocinitomix sp.]|nr:hypothetical protein [Crocinitomix sp.]